MAVNRCKTNQWEGQTGSTEAHLGVHVSPVQVDLCRAARMNQIADLADRLLEHTESGRVCDHKARNLVIEFG